MLSIIDSIDCKCQALTHSPSVRLPPFITFFDLFLSNPTLQAEPFLSSWKEALLESLQAFKISDSKLQIKSFQTFGLVLYLLFFFSRQTVFFECEHLFIDKPMVTTEPAVASARLSSHNTIITGEPMSVFAWCYKNANRLNKYLWCQHPHCWGPFTDGISNRLGLCNMHYVLMSRLRGCAGEGEPFPDKIWWVI